MTLPGSSSAAPAPGVGDGDFSCEAALSTAQPFAVLDLPADRPFIHQDRYWCVDCGGEQTFILVDRFACGWRGYCLGCEEAKFVMDTRTNSEVA